MSVRADSRAPRLRRPPAEQLERDAVEVVLERIRPALEAVFQQLRLQVEELVTDLVGRELAQRGQNGRIGETKCCRVCGLEGARNQAGLRPDHSQQDHERWKLTPRTQPTLRGRVARRRVERPMADAQLAVARGSAVNG
jgi:hypothetical protein